MPRVAWDVPSADADKAEIEWIRQYGNQHPDAMWPRKLLLRHILTRPSPDEGGGRAPAESSLSPDNIDLVKPLQRYALRWTSEEDRRLLQAEPRQLPRLAGQLGRTENSVRQRRWALWQALRLGLQIMATSDRPPIPRRRWTPEEDRLILESRRGEAPVLAVRLKRTHKAVLIRRSVLQRRQREVRAA